MTVINRTRVRYQLTTTKEGADWAALGATAEAWTCYRRTRGEAVADMLAGLTFRSWNAS
jgi:hypothetical protein